MKKLLEILVLCLFLITSSKADDISDFQIEGMSIGDSLLDYMSEEEIKANTYDVYSYLKDKTFGLAAFNTLAGYNFSKYEAVQIEFMKNDKNYIISTIHLLQKSAYENVGPVQISIGGTLIENAIAKAMNSKIGMGNAQYRLDKRRVFELSLIHI